MLSLFSKTDLVTPKPRKSKQRTRKVIKILQFSSVQFKVFYCSSKYQKRYIMDKQTQSLLRRSNEHKKTIK